MLSIRLGFELAALPRHDTLLTLTYRITPLLHLITKSNRLKMVWLEYGHLLSTLPTYMSCFAAVSGFDIENGVKLNALAVLVEVLMHFKLELCILQIVLFVSDITN